MLLNISSTPNSTFLSESWEWRGEIGHVTNVTAEEVGETQETLYVADARWRRECSHRLLVAGRGADALVGVDASHELEPRLEDVTFVTLGSVECNVVILEPLEAGGESSVVLFDALTKVEDVVVDVLHTVEASEPWRPVCAVGSRMRTIRPWADVYSAKLRSDVTQGGLALHSGSRAMCWIPAGLEREWRLGQVAGGTSLQLDVAKTASVDATELKQ